jgi:hypothetical protein
MEQWWKGYCGGGRMDDLQDRAIDLDKDAGRLVLSRNTFTQDENQNTLDLGSWSKKDFWRVDMERWGHQAPGAKRRGCL